MLRNSSGLVKDLPSAFIVVSPDRMTGGEKVFYIQYFVLEVKILKKSKYNQKQATNCMEWCLNFRFRSKTSHCKIFSK